MRKASIDIGSNSILLLIADFKANFQVLETQMRVTGLGRDIDKNNAFLDIAMKESFEALKEYRVIIDNYGIHSENIIMTATEASRVAENAKDFYQKVKDELGLKVTLITGEEEAYYSAKGVIEHSESLAKEEIIIMDIGGASTEFIKCYRKPFELLEAISVPMGSVRVTDWLSLGEEGKIDEILQSSSLDKFRANSYLCVAGTMTSIGNMLLNKERFDEENLNGYSFEVAHIDRILEKTNGWKSEDYLQEYPFLKKRSKVIQGGLYLAKKIFEYQNVEEVMTSTYGLMYGTILDIDKLKMKETE